MYNIVWHYRVANRTLCYSVAFFLTFNGKYYPTYFNRQLAIIMTFYVLNSGGGSGSGAEKDSEALIAPMCRVVP